MSRIFEHVWNEHGKCSFWTVYMMHVGVCPLHSTYLRLARILYMRYALCMCYIYHDSSRTVFLYRRVFKISVSNVSNVSIVVAVGLSSDTFTDTLACQVSKISLCIRYDGWIAYPDMWETNIEHVRFHCAKWSPSHRVWHRLDVVCVYMTILGLYMDHVWMNASSASSICFWMRR